MDGSGIRWICKAAQLYRGTGVEGVDAVCDSLAVCAALGTAEDKAGHEPGDHAGFHGAASEWEGAARSGGMGCASAAQCDFACGSDCHEADARSGTIRFQLALGDRNGMFLGCDSLGIAAGAGTGTVDEDLLENAGANAAGNDCNLVHARAGLRDALFGAGCRAGPGIYADGMVVSILRDISGVVGGCAYGERYVLERAVWQPAANYFSTTGD